LTLAIETGIVSGTLVTIIARRSVAFVIRGRANSSGRFAYARHLTIVLHRADDRVLSNTNASFASV